MVAKLVDTIGCCSDGTTGFVLLRDVLVVLLLFDIASSVSVWVLCTWRTHSAGVTKYIAHRSHLSAAVMSASSF